MDCVPPFHSTTERLHVNNEDVIQSYSQKCQWNPQLIFEKHRERWYSDSAEVYKIDYRTAITYPTTE